MNSCKILIISCLVSFIIGYVGAQPVNDFCSGAIPITPAVQGTGCSSASFILPFASDGTTDSGVPFTCTNPGKDQWFTWTATSDALEFTSLSPGNPGIAVYANCADANSGSAFDCQGTSQSGRLSGWNVGDNLIIQLHDLVNSTSNIAFCLEEFTLAPPPANDLCSGAIPITPAAAGTGCSTAGFTLPFLSDGTTDSGVPTVCSTPGNDQWFTWTATSDGLAFNGLSPGSPGIAIYSTCADANAGSAIDCKSPVISGTLSGWAVGDNLLIQIYDSQGGDSDISFCLEEFTVTPPPANDVCAGAIPITPAVAGTGCSSAGFTLPFSSDGTTDSGVPTVCVNPGNDQWFTWTATSDALAFTSLFPSSPGIAIFSTCADANAGAAIDCINTLQSGTLSGWAVGDNLLIQLYDLEGQNSDISFCLEEFTVPPPVNDLCSGAIPITPAVAGTGCSTAGFTLPFSVDRTTDSGVPFTCAVTGKDQWFTWTATSDALAFTSLPLGTPGIAIFSNCADANTGSEIDCRKTNQNGTLSGWAVGDNLLIQIYTSSSVSSSDVSFCLEEFSLPSSPANDLCTGAIPITPAVQGTGCTTAGFTLPFSTDGTTDSGVPGACITPGKDQWFTWTATSEALDFTGLTPGFPGIAIFANCADANTGTAIDCKRTSSAGFLSGWSIGDNLLIQIYGVSGATLDVSFCLEEFTQPPPPVNDLCSGAIPITPSAAGTGCSTSGFTLPFRTDGTTDSGVPQVCSSPGRDQWFTWTATSGALKFTAISPGRPGIAIFSNCADANTGSAIDCVNSNQNGTLSGWAVGDNLLIQLYALFGSSADIDFCLEESTPPPPVNDVCAGAIPITPSAAGTGCSTPGFTLPFASDGTTDSGVPSVCTTPGNDQWFTWTATSNALIFTSLSPGNPGIAIFSNCADANAGVEIDCKNTFVSGRLSGWNVGDNLLIQLYDFAGSSSDISFCLEEFTIPPPPANDLCSGAIPITPAVAGTGCSMAGFTLPFFSDGTTDSGVPTVCSNPGLDQWFTWTATSDALLFTSLSPGDPGVAIFSNCADANTGTAIDCKNTVNTGTLSGWAVGDNLLIQLYDLPGSNSDVSFCLEEFTLPPPPVNDFCSGAIPITPALAGACCNTAGFIFPFSTDGTTDSGVPAVCSAPGKDRWFTWTASTDALKFTAKTPGGGGIAIFSDCIHASSGNTTNCFSQFFTDTTSSPLATFSGWSVGDDLLIQIFNSQVSDSDVAFCLQEFSLAPLPVTLVSFQGEEVGDNNVLSWVTGAEHNTERHVVERSADGTTWQDLGERIAEGFSTVEQAYEFIDETPMSTSYYRLRSVDFDGTFQVSEVISLQRKEVGFSMNRIFPNPVTEMLFLDFSTDMVSEFNISITDLNGRVLYAAEYRSAKGLNRHEIDVAQLPAGIYLINMTSGKMQYTRRVVRI